MHIVEIIHKNVLTSFWLVNHLVSPGDIYSWLVLSSIRRRCFLPTSPVVWSPMTTQWPESRSVLVSATMAGTFRPRLETHTGRIYVYTRHGVMRCHNLQVELTWYRTFDLTLFTFTWRSDGFKAISPTERKSGGFEHKPLRLRIWQSRPTRDSNAWLMLNTQISTLSGLVLILSWTTHFSFVSLIISSLDLSFGLPILRCPHFYLPCSHYYIFFSISLNMS